MNVFWTIEKCFWFPKSTPKLLHLPSHFWYLDMKLGCSSAVHVILLVYISRKSCEVWRTLKTLGYQLLPFQACIWILIKLQEKLMMCSQHACFIFNHIVYWLRGLLCFFFFSYHLFWGVQGFYFLLLILGVPYFLFLSMRPATFW